MFKIKNLPFRLILVILALVLLVPTTVFANSPRETGPPPVSSPNSVRILIDGQEVEGPIRKDGVVHRGELIDGRCHNPSIAIRARGDVRKVSVGPDGDTCNLKVKVLELNYTELAEADAAFSTAAGYKWRLDILSLVEGIPPEFDDLTKTRSKFTFKTTSFTNSGSLFDGGGTYSACWAHYGDVIYWYEVESCTPTDDLTSSNRMFHKVVG